MDKIRFIRTIEDLPITLTLIVGFLSLGRTGLNPTDIFFTLLATFSILKEPRAYISLIRQNRLYFVISSLFVFVMFLSVIHAHRPENVFKNVLQTIAYLLILPAAIRYDFDLKKPFLLISPFILMYSLVFFCSTEPVRLKILYIHPNALGFILSLLAFINMSFPSYLLFSFLSSLTFSRASLLSLSLSTMLISLLRKNLKVFFLSLIPLILIITMPRISKFYRDSEICHIVRDTRFPTNIGPAVDINVLRIYDFERLKIWEASLKVFMKSPIFGIGSGNFQEAIEVECGSGYLSKDLCSASLPYEDPHNIFLSVLMEMGVVGFVIFFILFLYVFYQLFKKRCYEELCIFTFSFLASLLHPSPFFTVFLGPLIWYRILRGSLSRNG